MRQEHVVDVLTDERDYQDERWGSPQDAGYESYEVTQFAIDFEKHLNNLKSNLYNMQTSSALHEVRKLGALAIKCGEVHGLPRRKVGLIGE